MMTDRRKAGYENLWDLILKAGQSESHEEFTSFIGSNAGALEEGALASMRLLGNGSVHMENAFAVLDALKGVATRNTIRRAESEATGHKYGLELSRSHPGHISYYLQSRPHPTAIVSFHFIGSTRLA